MAEKKLYSITLNFKGRKPNYTALKEAFDTAVNWYRYAPNCWVVWSTKTPEKWAALLRKKAHKNDSIFICEINESNHQGWMPKSFWDWLNKQLK